MLFRSHDWRGHSQWNTAHGISKAAQLGYRDHLLTAGHTHVSGYQIVRDPLTGLLTHCLRIGSYKAHDRYAEQKGFAAATFTVCPIVVVRPRFDDDDARFLTVHFDPESGIDYLSWLRGRKSE